MPHMNYSMYMERGMEGKVATADATDIATGYNIGNQDLPNGRVLVQSGNDSGVALPSGASQKPIGISVADGSKENNSNGILSNAPKQSVNRLKRGTVWMVVENDVTPNSVVHYRHTVQTTPGTFDAIGRVRGGANSTFTAELPNARFEESAKAGELVQLSVMFV